LKDAVEQLLGEYKMDPLPWNTLEMYRNFLKPFADHTDFIQGSKYPTIPSVIPALINLDGHLQKEIDSGDDISDLAATVKYELKRRFSYIFDTKEKTFDPAYVTATMLDPTVALCLDDGQLAASKNFFIQMNSDYPSISPQDIEKQATPSHLSSAVMQKIEQRRHSAVASASLGIQNEFSSYLNMLETGHGIVDCTDFWVHHKDRFQRLNEIAVDIFAVPATSAPLEGFFSQASSVLDGKRYRLSSQSLESELFLRVNSRYF